MKKPLFAVIGIFALTSCIDPAMPREGPEVTDSSLVMLMVLDPSRSVERDGGQAVVVTTSVVTDTLLKGLQAVLQSMTGEQVSAHVPHDRCPYFGSYAAKRECLGFAHVVQPGQTYRVTVSADGYPTASAEAQVPGEFQITEHHAGGSPPGTGGLTVRWSESPGAYRYIVAIRADSTPRCFPDCTGWMTLTQETEFVGEVPTEALDEGRGPWWLDVYAVNRSLTEYLSSGTPGNLFSVPPAGNVNGGYGVVGAWLRRSIRLAEPYPSS